MDETNMNERLIEKVKTRPALYDKNEEHYYNRNYVNKAWKEIGKELGVDANLARKRWVSMRDYFQRTNKHQMLGPLVETGFKKKKKWYLYDRMLFLQPHVSIKHGFPTPSDPSTSMFEDTDADALEKFSNMSADSLPPSEGSFSLPTRREASEPDTSTLEVEVDETESEQKANNEDIDWTATDWYSKKRKVEYFKEPTFLEELETEVRAPHEDNEQPEYHSHYSQRGNSLSRDILKTIQSVSKIKNAEREVGKDEDELFLQSLVPKMRTLNSLSKLECQAEMLMLLLKYKRRDLNPQPTGLVKVLSHTEKNTPSTSTSQQPQ